MKGRFKELIKILNFKPKEGVKDVWIKNYSVHDNYTIELDFNKQKVNYGNKIICEDRTTSNFRNEENLVVLECVNRLLEKKYSPEKIILEKNYPLGHRDKGKLDILVLNNDDTAYLMIECKTFGDEFEKELKKMQTTHKSQLFSYFQQDKSAKYLCLYTSKFENDNIEYKNKIIEITESILEANNVEESYERWNKNFKDNGIFENWAKAYGITIKALRKSELKPLTKDNSSKIFNQFAEILRHNVVSDKPNAFNKLITLLLCKIVDENRHADDEIHFQWLDSDTDVELQKRLSNLYKKGMKEYLTKEVTDYDDKDVDKIIGLTDEQKTQFKQMLTDVRLKKNNEFAFKEVYNEDTFKDNARVLKEIVELIQPYKMRYNRKHQFLGEFFELLLNTSIKQEAGQFFTPIPIARFIVNSIPFKEIINKKIENSDVDFLPYIIDFACGSGHFLTESMDEINNIIYEIEQNISKYKPSVKGKIKSWADKDNQFEWAYNYIYGIDKDYRLVKTSKVSCFLNGDGLARIINADGLAPFNCKDYQEKLSKKNVDDKDLMTFDVLIANPPYSVSNFRNTLEKGKNSFTLYDKLTSNSSEIECLFIERLKQLLKIGGYAGIILPSSILSNTGIYTDAREIILKYFKIVSIVELGSNTFMATGTNTVILFLERRANHEWEHIESIVNNFFVNPIDVSCNGIENVFSIYVNEVYENILFEDYVSFIQQKPSEKVKEHDLYIDYLKKYNKNNDLDFQKVFEIEKEKLLYFILAYPQKVAIIKTGEKQAEKNFLGYEFSNRRGHEGIKPYQDENNVFLTKLYDENVSLNSEKANTYVYNSFLNQAIDIHESLSENVSYTKLSDMITFDRVEFIKQISLNVKKKFKSKWELVKIDSIISIVESGNRPAGGVGNIKEGIPSLGGEHISLHGEVILNNTKYVPVDYFLQANQGILEIGDILICKDGALTGKVAIVKDSFQYKEAMINEHLFLIRSNQLVNQKYLFLFLYSEYGQLMLKNNITGSAQGGLNKNNLLSIKIPLPPKEVQERIVKEIEVVEKEENDAKAEFEKSRLNIEQKADEVYIDETVQLSIMCEPCQYGANESAIAGNPDKDYRYIRITDIDDNGNLLDEFKTAKNIDGQYILKEGDFLFARSGATVGKTFLYRKNMIKAIFAGYLIRFRPLKDKLIPEFLNFVTKSSKYRQWVKSTQRKHAQPNINGQEYSSFQIPNLSLEVQKEIVSQIEQNIEQLEQRLIDYELEKKAILEKYLF